VGKETQNRKSKEANMQVWLLLLVVLLLLLLLLLL